MPLARYPCSLLPAADILSRLIEEASDALAASRRFAEHSYGKCQSATKKAPVSRGLHSWRWGELKTPIGTFRHIRSI